MELISIPSVLILYTSTFTTLLLSVTHLSLVLSWTDENVSVFSKTTFLKWGVRTPLNVYVSDSVTTERYSIVPFTHSTTTNVYLFPEIVSVLLFPPKSLIIDHFSNYL